MKATNKRSTQGVPEGFHTVTPFLVVDGVERLINFVHAAFDSELLFISKDDDNQVIHATVSIGNSKIMLADAMGMPAQTAMLYLYVSEVDQVFQKAVKAGGKPVHEPNNEFYGDRAGAIKDDWGNTWWIAKNVEQLDEKELDRRAKEMMRERKNKEAVSEH